MEIEYKFQLNSGKDFNQIYKFLESSSDYQVSGKTRITMLSYYYDTDDGVLGKAGIAFRLRHENETLVATVKIPVFQADGLYHREELNRQVLPGDIASKMQLADIERLTGFDLSKEKLAPGNPELQEICTIGFEREEFTCYTDRVSLIVSYDTGQITRTDGSVIPVSELEIELLDGEISELDTLSDLLIDRFQLVKDPISKLAKAFL